MFLRIAWDSVLDVFDESRDDSDSTTEWKMVRIGQIAPSIGGKWAVYKANSTGQIIIEQRVATARTLAAAVKVFEVESGEAA